MMPLSTLLLICMVSSMYNGSKEHASLCQIIIIEKADKKKRDIRGVSTTIPTNILSYYVLLSSPAQ